MPKEIANNQNQTFTEQDARIVINRKLQDAGWILEGPDKNVLTEQHSEAGFISVWGRPRTSPPKADGSGLPHQRHLAGARRLCF
jgi:hypothetical protein